MCAYGRPCPTLEFHLRFSRCCEFFTNLSIAVLDHCAAAQSAARSFFHALFLHRLLVVQILQCFGQAYHFFAIFIVSVVSLPTLNGSPLLLYLREAERCRDGGNQAALPMLSLALADRDQRDNSHEWERFDRRV